MDVFPLPYFRQMSDCLSFSIFVACDRRNPLLGARLRIPRALGLARARTSRD